MDNKLVGLLGAVATLAMVDAVQAAPEPIQNPTEVLKASSFDDLLKPIPNAAHLLRAIDERGPAKPAEAASDVQVAQFVYPYYHLPTIITMVMASPLSRRAFPFQDVTIIIITTIIITTDTTNATEIAKGGVRTSDPFRDGLEGV